MATECTTLEASDPPDESHHADSEYRPNLGEEKKRGRPRGLSWAIKMAAKNFNVSPEMMRQASILSDRAPDLAEACRKGTIKIGAAWIELKRRDHEASLKNVPEDLRTYFSQENEFAEIGRLLDRAASRLTKLTKHPAGHFLDAAAIRQNLVEIKMGILVKQPSAICPFCDEREKNCWCKGTGVITAGVRKALEDADDENPVMEADE